MRNFLVAMCVFVLGAASARGQFTSAWSTVYLPGSFNGYDTVNSGMRLVSNGVWQGYFRITNGTGVAFLFSNHQFSNPPTNNANVWKEFDQSQFEVPMVGTAELNVGSDISITGTVSGIFRVRFVEANGLYSVAMVNFGVAPSEPWINELHYDNVSTDKYEGVEMAGPAGLVLTNYSLVFYNGDAGSLSTYRTTVLTGALTNGLGGGLGVKNFTNATDGIQNGDPDGLALVKGGTNVIQFLSYGGLFIPINGPASNMVPQDLGVKEDGTTTPVDYSLQLAGSGGTYADFSWAAVALNSRERINSNQLALAGPTAANVSVSSVVANPASAQTNQPVSVSATITALSGASNVSATLFWRAGGFGSFQPVRMTNAGAVWTAASNIPPHPNGTVVRFYVFVNFDGAGTNSPALNPAAAPDTFYSVSFSSTFQGGSVWINEVDPVYSIFSTNYAEFVELAGTAGNDISGWKVELVDAGATNYATYFMPGGTVLANQTNGFGFSTLGTTNLLPAPRVGFTNLIGNYGQMTDAGGVRLYDQNGALIHAISYNTALSGFTYAGYDPNANPPEELDEFSVAMINTGSNLASFAWGTNTPPTYGKINNGQIFTNGNTAPILPLITCPADIRLDCTNTVPTNNPLSVVSTGYCGNGSVTVTWLGDTNNAGSGCKGSARVIYRTYRSVSACGTTNTCTQLIIMEDTNAPVIIAPTQTLANAGFENGSTFGWQSFGSVTNQSAVPQDARSGVFSGVLSPPYGAVCFDSSFTENNGTYMNGTLRMQTNAASNLVRSATFDGVNDYVSIPGPILNTTNMTITAWIRRNGTQVDYAGLVFSRAGSTLSGFAFGTGNQLGYHWNGAVETYGWASGVVPPDNQWAFVALTVSKSQAEIYMRVAGSNSWVYAVNAFTNHTVDAWDGEIRLGHDNTANRYFKGGMDDVQIYNRTLSSNDLMGIWNNGLGGGTTNALIGHYKLDDFFPGPTQSGLYQDLPAAVGQTWNGAIWARPNPNSPLAGTNTVRAALQFLNATNGVLSNSVASIIISNTSPLTAYARLIARGTAPTNTAKARLLVTYHQDADGSQGQVLLDDAILTDTLHTPGTIPSTCGTLANYRNNGVVSITDNCSGTNISYIQSPAAGSAITNGTIPVTVTALDSCGNSAQATFTVIVDDVTPPLTFGVTPTAVAFACPSNTTVITTNSVFDNCPGWTVTQLSSVTNNGLGCPGSPIVITNLYLVTDIGGNVRTSNFQVITISDTNLPATILSLPVLTNGGFETGGFSTNWATYGNATVLNLTPRTGTNHAKLAGQTNGNDNYNGIYQDLATTPGETWRLGAWVLTPTNELLTGSNFLEAKIEFFDAGFGNLGTFPAPVITNGSLTPGLYRQISVTAPAPAGAVRARATLNFVQANNAPGSIFLDDVSLSRTTYTADTGCDALIADLTTLVTNLDCGLVTVTQSPPAGLTLTNGTNTVRLFSVDNCGNTRTTTVLVVVLDDLAPLITNAPTNLVVATTNDVPPANTNLITGLDTCTTNLTRTVLPDETNGGAGTTNNPLIILRTYRLADQWGNTAQTTQTITVNGATGTPPPPTNVAIITHGLVFNPAGLTNTIRTTGTNTWSVLPEYTTNLLGLPLWQPASNIANNWNNGTNTTTYTLPTNAHPAYIRIKQTYP